MIIRPTAENMLEEIQNQNNMKNDLRQIGLHFDELTVQEGSPLLNHEISEIEINSNHGFLIVGIRRADGVNEVNPDHSTRLAAGDVVIVLGHEKDIPELVKRFSTSGKRMIYRGVTIDS